MDKASMSHLISFSRYQTKCIIKFLFIQLMMSWIFNIFIGSSSKAMADGKKEGKTKIQKFEYLENKKSFLDEIKNILHGF